MKSNVRPHLPEDELHAFADGALSSAQREEVAQHLLACLICRAAEAEVLALQARASHLLEIASPPIQRRPRQSPPVAAPSPARRTRWGTLALPSVERRRMPMAAAAAIMLTGATTFMAWRANEAAGVPQPGLATAFVASPLMAAPALFGSRAGSEAAIPTDATSYAVMLTARTLTLASRAAMAPRVITPLVPVTRVSGRRLRAIDPMSAVEPGEGWRSTSWANARRASQGAVAHLSQLPITTVHLQDNPRGGRPTAMVRQQLRDGRAVWVIEGAESELRDVAQLLAASGLTLSTPRRARPDYVGPADAPERIIRMVAIAAYLPVDSLDAMAEERLRVE